MPSYTNLALLGLGLLSGLASAWDQAPALPGRGAPISDSDRLYTGDQSSNTITVIKPTTGEVLGTISLGDSRLTNDLNPQYVRAVNSHGLGFSPDGKLIVSLAVTSNTVTVFRTEDNSVVSQTSVDRNAHEAFFERDNRHVWVGTRGVDRIDIVDGLEGGVVGYVQSYGGPSKVVFSPDGKTAYANHVRSASLSVIDVAERRVVANITGLGDAFSSDMMISPDGRRLWAPHKMAGKVSVIDLVERRVVGVMDTGPETNHANFAVINGTMHGFITVASTNQTLMYSQPQSGRMPVLLGAVRASGVEPHGLWPSADNTRLYVVNEHSDTVDFIDLTVNPPKVVKTINVAQEGQAIVYVSGAVSAASNGTQNLGRQGLFDKPALNKLLAEAQPQSSVSGAKARASCLVTVRPEIGLDMFQVIGRNLAFNTTYTVAATVADRLVPLVDFTATASMGDGCGTAPQVLAFFKFIGVYEVDDLVLTSKADA
ncbi:nitrous oxide reductase [Trichoderma novae-zelandiae]